MQHSLQQTLEQSRDPSRKSTARSTTAVLEQLRDHIRSVPQAPRRSACKTAGRGKLRTRDRTEKEGAKLNEEGGESSSVDEVDARRKRPPCYKESPCFRLTHLQPDTSLHLHVTTLRAHGRCSNEMWYHERASVHFARSLWHKPGVSDYHCRSSLRQLVVFVGARNTGQERSCGQTLNNDGLLSVWFNDEDCLAYVRDAHFLNR